MTENSADTPAVRQYKRIKSSYPDAFLFFRMGDFYEMFDSDARQASSLLDLVLTKRAGQPMCGIPYHAASAYIGRLLKAGKKVAICEQKGEVQKGGKVMERVVTEVISPGTAIVEDYLDKNSNNYLFAIGKTGSCISVAYIDLSTGEFSAAKCTDSEKKDFLRKELFRLSPGEILIQETLYAEDQDIASILDSYKKVIINRFPDWQFDMASSVEAVKRQFNVISLKGLGFEETDPELLSAGVILDYIHLTSQSLLPHITSLTKYDSRQYMYLDESSLRNLEILRNIQDGSSRYTLIDVLDHTKTSAGSRLIKKWLSAPLTSISDIRKRHDTVDIFYRNQILLSNMRQCLASVMDMERICSKVAMDKANARDLEGLKNSFAKCMEIISLVSDWHQEGYFPFLGQETLDHINRLYSYLDSCIGEDLPIVINEGGMIKQGYNQELDHLRSLRDNSQSILDEYMEQERSTCSIPNLKLRYNKVIGYFLEVTKSYIKNVPSYYIRKQSTLSSERFTTEKLTELETELNSAYDKIVSLERELFIQIRDKIKKEIPFIIDLAENVSEIDCYQSFADAATAHGYIKPKVTDKTYINIKGGRHPVVEANLPPGDFIENDFYLESGKENLIMLTGPNMAGKSTFLRQNAIIVLMAQAGSFVPATEAEIGVVDKMFCRVGASDNLARGESTFLVEMSETANILRCATQNSFIIMDEVGRGTGTNDGLAIAWSICEYLTEKCRAKTIFATHYHELTQMDNPDVVNMSMNASEERGKLVFLKKIVRGAASKSYGIHVAELAGIPYEIIVRAKELMAAFEKETKAAVVPEQTGTMDLFPQEDLLRSEILSADISNMTPVQALTFLSDLQERYK